VINSSFIAKIHIICVILYIVIFYAIAVVLFYYQTNKIQFLQAKEQHGVQQSQTYTKATSWRKDNKPLT